MTQSYIQVLSIIEAYAASNIMVKRFHSDFAEQINQFSNSEETFPVIYVEPLDNTYLLNTTEYNLRVYCFDRLTKDRSNLNSVLTNCDTILNGLKLWFSEENNSLPVMVLNEPVATPINNFTNDFCAGWYFDLQIEVRAFSLCQIPFVDNPVITGYTSDVFYTNDYLTCSELSECPVIQEISGDTITGGTFNSSTLTLNQTDGDSISITGFTSTDYFATGATLIGSTAYFNRNDLLSAYTLNLSSFTPSTSGFSGWTGSTGIQSLVANNGTGNLAGAFTIVAGNNNQSNGQYSVIGGGNNNYSNYSNTFIGGGSTNSAMTSNASIVGGVNNAAYGDKSIIGAGANNIVISNYTSILGGRSNSATNNYSSVVGGRYNTASGTVSIVVGGQNNTASGNYSGILAGKSNTASNTNSIVIGGDGNTVNGISAAILNGNGNIASGNNSVILNGGTSGGYYYNTASGNHTLIGNGQSNQAIGQFATVINGYQNQAIGTMSTVVGGNYNQATAYGTIVGGQNNTATKNFAIALGGKLNNAGGYYNAVIGGQNNISSTSNSGIFVGQFNTVSALNSAIIGGSGITATQNNTVYVPALNVTSGATISGNTTMVSTNAGFLFDLTNSGQPIIRFTYPSGSIQTSISAAANNFYFDAPLGTMNFRGTAGVSNTFYNDGRVKINDQTGLANNAQLEVVNADATRVALMVNGTGAQSANLQEWQRTGTTKAYIDNSGGTHTQSLEVSGNSIFDYGSGIDLKIRSISNQPAIWINQSAPNTTNFALLGSVNDTFLNASSSAHVYFAIGGNQVGNYNSSKFTFLNPILASTISASTISATTYLNLPSSTFTGGTVIGLTATTISATTYLNLPTDVFVTGGTHSNGTSTFRNNTGGTFNVTGFQQLSRVVLLLVQPISYPLFQVVEQI